MIEQIDVVYANESGDQALALPIAGLTPKDSLLLRKVTGLSPADIDLFIGEYSRDGGIYQGRRVGTRNVVMTITLNPNPALGETVSGLRELLYKIFLDPRVTADYTQIIFREVDGRSRYVVGYVEKIETEPFDMESVMQISMICPDPYIRDLLETVLTNLTGWITIPFTYGGTAETGFQTKIKINSNTGTLTLANNGRTMVLNYAFLAGDVVTINTVRGSRSIQLTRGGVTTSIAAYLTAASQWLELHSQANSMTVYGVTTGSLPAAVTELKYTTAYWGV